MELTQEDLDKYVGLKDAIQGKCAEMAKVFGIMDDYYDSVDAFDLDLSNKQLEIVIGWSSRGEYNTERYWYPIDYLFKTKEELESIRRKNLEKAEQEKMEMAKKLEQTEKEKRRMEYLKLKEEFEGEKKDA